MLLGILSPIYLVKYIINDLKFKIEGALYKTIL